MELNGKKNKSSEKESKELSRREFLKDAGLVVGGAAIGYVGIASACGTTSTTTGTQTQPAITLSKVAETVIVPVALPKSNVIGWDANKCVACGRCLQACASFHEGGTSATLSAIKWFDNKWFDGWDGVLPAYPFFCQQCNAPECYNACPQKDKALCIDATTGARYINKANCIGCGLCIQACPLSPARINLDPPQKKAIKCDLCKDRTGGPVCIYVCDRQALTLVPKEGRI